MSWFRRRRRSARVVLVDPSGRVLLLRVADSIRGASAYWYLPGGGILPLEAVQAAARRELREETGIRQVELGPVIGERSQVSFTFRGRQVVQDEWYVAGRVSTPHIGSGRHGDGERRAVEGHRWWTLEELVVSADAVFPPELNELVRRTLAWAGEVSAPEDPNAAKSAR